MSKADVDINTKPFVSVIIPVYNDGVRLKKCLQALQFQTYPYAKYEVIVVDNASDYDIVGVVKQFHKARYDYESKQGSYAARNKGLDIAKGEIIAFTDSDCIPNSNWIFAGVQTILENPAAGIVAGHIEFFFAGQRPTIGEYVDSISNLQQAYYARHYHFGATGNAFTKRSVVDRVGNFNDQLYSMGDKEWGQRVWRAGYEVIYSELASVRHPARNTQELLIKTRRCTQGNWEIEKSLIWSKFWSQVTPINPINYYQVFRDDNLVTLRDKLAFILLVNRLKYMIAFQMLGYWWYRKTAKVSAFQVKQLLGR